MNRVRRKKNIIIIIRIFLILLLIGIIFVIILYIENKKDEKTGEKEFTKTVNNMVNVLEDRCNKQKSNNEVITKSYLFEDGKVIPNVEELVKVPKNGIIKLDDSCNAVVNVSNDFYIAIKNLTDNDITVQYGQQSAYKSYNIGDKISFDPGDGIIRTWYVMKNSPFSDEKIEVILENNLEDNSSYAYLENSANGPTKILDDLRALTSNWINTDMINKSIDNIDYSGFHARLIMANEIANITENDTWNSSINTSLWYYLDTNSQIKKSFSKGRSKYAWLFNYTKDCTKNGCNYESDNSYGYWTSSKDARSNKHAWGVARDGSIDSDVVTSTSKGIRPVIVIDKSKI